jgi:FG-GAP-like repeat
MGGTPTGESGAGGGGAVDAGGGGAVDAGGGGAVDAGGAPANGGAAGAGGAEGEPEPACGDGSAAGGLLCFGAPQPLSLLEGTAMDVAIGAWDATEGLDVVVAGGSLFYFSNGGGVFEQETYVPGAAPALLGTGQLDSGTKLDLVIGQSISSSPTVAFGDGAGAITISQTALVGYEGAPFNFYVSDVVGSGASQDFVSTYPYGISVVVTSGTEGEGFQENASSSFYPDGNDQLDAVLAKLGSAQWVVYSAPGSIERRRLTYNVGAVTFGEALVTAVVDNPAQLDVGDFNEDGFDDVVATSADGGNVSVLFADGAGTGDFAIVEGTDRFLSLVIGTSDEAKTQRDVKVADFNGDGHADVAVSVAGLDSVAIFAGDGEGAFSQPVLLSTGEDSRPTRLAVGDLNDDGLDDVANVATDGRVVLLLSEP